MKRIISILLVMSIFLGVMPGKINAATSGTCGDSATWSFDSSTGTLTISGSGEMNDYSAYGAPWYSSSYNIKTIIIEEGITYIGTWAFYNATELTEIQLPNEIIIGEYAFSEAFKAASSISVSLPENVIVGKRAFMNANVATLTVPGTATLNESAFYSMKELTSVVLHEGITELPNYMFEGCSKLTELTIPSTVNKIGSCFVIRCDLLTTITLGGNVPEFAGDAFDNGGTSRNLVVYYPKDNATYTDAVKQTYGNNGTVTWLYPGQVAGYTTGITSTTTKVSVDDKVSISVSVNHHKDTVFNAGELQIGYNSGKLSFNQAASTLGTATIKDTTGTLLLEDYGEDKNLGDSVYVLVFDAIADGEAYVNLISSAFINKTDAVSSDLIASAAVTSSNVTITINKKVFKVTLPEGFSGAESVTDGESYTFGIADNNYNYTNIAATVDGSTVSVTDNGDGTYTIDSVTGELVITANRTAKTYNVTFQGNAADDITDGATTATYGENYTFTIPTADNFAYTLENITIGGNTYTGYTSANSVCTIEGSAITGDIVITVSKVATQVTVTVDGASGDLTYDSVVNVGDDFTFTLTPEAGYVYEITATMGETEVTVIDNKDNTYTIENVTDNLKLNITKTVDTTNVIVTEYVKLDGTNMWLIKHSITVVEGKVPAYAGKAMFWSEKYNAYCYLAIAETLDVETAKTSITIITGTKTDVDYEKDVNKTGTVDASDAQLTYNIYNAQYSNFSSITIEKALRADINGDSIVNVTDATAIINFIIANK